MPYLNWREATLAQSVETDADGRKSSMSLALPAAELPALLERLEETFRGGAGETRVDLPEEWTIFWKLREDGESRLLIAHPQEKQWVATVALERGHGERLTEGLRAMTPGATLRVGALGSVASVSNLELWIRLEDA